MIQNALTFAAELPAASHLAVLSNDLHCFARSQDLSAFCWLQKRRGAKEPDQLFLKIFADKAFSRAEETLIASSQPRLVDSFSASPACLEFPAIKFIEGQNAVVAWLENRRSIFMQIVNADGVQIGERLRSCAFENLVFSRTDMMIVLDYFFPEPV